MQGVGGDGGGANKVRTETDRAYTYGADWSLPITPQAAMVGSIHTGYSKHVRITFEVPRPATAHWCGTMGFPADPGQRVQAVQR